MKKVLTLLAVLAMVSCASATVRVFVTTSSAGYGLANPANHMIPTVSTVLPDGTNLNTWDYYNPDYTPGPIQPGTYPPAGAPSGTDGSPVQIANGDWAYIWVQFQSEPNGAKINGLQIKITDPSVPGGAANNINTVYYLCNNQNSLLRKRWDGVATPPNYPEFVGNNPQTLVAITAYGLANGNAAIFDQLWSGGAGLRIALLGAVEAPADGSIYHIDITNISYASPPNPAVAGGVFQFVPEPTSLLLMGLAGLLIRRR